MTTQPKLENTQHTPGPWVFTGLHKSSENSYTGYIDFRHGSAEEGNRASGTIAQVDSWTTLEAFEECEANARLIASAPDLLVALLNARIALSGERSPLLERMDAAIAKATGA